MAPFLVPSAFNIVASRLPSASKIVACFLPVAIITAASRWPSASITVARRLRSAAIWRVIASSTARGGTTSRISTAITRMPQRSVTSSSFSCKTLLISSRFESTSSRSIAPTTARNVVIAKPRAAPVKSSTSKTLRSGSITLSYTRKSMLTEALSAVIHVCGGTSKNTSRKSTKTGRSTNGIRKIIPGPCAPIDRPTRKTTSLLYSGIMRTDIEIKITTISAINIMRI